MNADCLILIFEHLNFGELLNVAKMNSKFATLTAYAFRYKYPNRPIHIKDDFRFPNETELIEEPIAPYRELKRGIIINDYYTIIYVFKYLYVSNVVFNYGTSYMSIHSSRWSHHINQAKFMGELISNYSESLKEVSFEWCSKNSLEFITKPLCNAKVVRFLDSSPRFSNETLPINKLFPSIEKLYLEMEAKNLDYFDSHMPNLWHLYIRGESRGDTATEHFKTGLTYRHLMDRNPQIRSIIMGSLVDGKYVEADSR